MIRILIKKVGDYTNLFDGLLKSPNAFSSQEKLREYFGQFGSVTDVLVMKDPITQVIFFCKNRTRGYFMLWQIKNFWSVRWRIVKIF